MPFVLEVLLAELARAQLGVFTRAQALELGYSSATIARRVASGEWLVLHPGVYVLASTPMSHLVRAKAATLAAGEGAVAAFETSAALHGRADMTFPARVQILAPDRRRRTSARGYEIHRWSGLTDRDSTRIRSISCTNGPLTVALLSSRVDLATLELLVLETGRASRTAIPKMHEYCDRLGTGFGTANLLRLLSIFDPEQLARLMAISESRLIRLVRRGGVPMPLVNSRLHEDDGTLIGRVDARWPEHRVTVEVDGLRFHSTPTQKRYDDRRQNAAVLTGELVLRYDARILTDEPERVLDELRRALALRRPA